MTGRRCGIPLGVGVSAVLLLVGAAVFRGSSTALAPAEEPSAPGAGSVATPVSGTAGTLAARDGEQGSGDPKSPEGIGRRPLPEGSGSDPEVEQAYRDYRVALSTHDRKLEDALYPVLLAHRELALGVARRELALASSPEERALSERAVRFLSDPPGPRRFHHLRRDP